MTRSLKAAVFACALTLVVGLAVGGTSVSADTDGQENTATTPAAILEAQAAQADRDGFIIVDSQSATEVGDATFYPTGPISSDTLVVIPNADGSLPISARQLEAIAARRSTASHPAESAAAPASTTPSAAAATNYAWSASSAGFSSPFTGGSLIGLTVDAVANY